MHLQIVYKPFKEDHRTYTIRLCFCLLPFFPTTSLNFSLAASLIRCFILFQPELTQIKDPSFPDRSTVFSSVLLEKKLVCFIFQVTHVQSFAEVIMLAINNKAQGRYICHFARTMVEKGKNLNHLSPVSGICTN